MKNIKLISETKIKKMEELIHDQNTQIQKIINIRLIDI